MRFLVTGITGLIGQHFREFAKQKGHEIHYLTTRQSKIEAEPGYQGFYWNPEKDLIDKTCLKGVDQIVHLAGASVARRWTARHKKNILQSRIRSTELLYRLLTQQPHQVQHLVSASAIGIYPGSASRLYDEYSTERAQDFLGSVVQEWERAVDKLEETGIAVAKIRIGLVLAPDGGVLPAFKKTITHYMGSCLGSGRQWQSWIHIYDLAALFTYVAEHRLTGVFNGVAPNPVTQKNMIKSMARHLHRPLFLPPVPELLLKAVLGEMAKMVLSSQLVVNSRLADTDFQFHFSQLEKALEDLL